MQFLRTLFPAFFIWQFFSLSPFVLSNDSLMPKLSHIHNVISAISIGIQLTVIVYGLVDFKHYIAMDDRSMIKIFGDIFSMSFVRVSCISIVIESWAKRSLQISFLNKINEIDTILNKKLQISINYEIQRKKSIRRLIAMIGLYLCLQTFVITVAFDPEMSLFGMFCALYSVPLFVCTMRVYQFISYVDLITCRYQLINKCIETLILKKTFDDVKTLDKFPQFVYNRSFFIGQDKKLEAHLIMNKIKHLRDTYRLLINVNQMLCRLFNWSMLASMFNDYSNALINLYWLTMNVVQQGSKLEFFFVFAWSLFNMIMLISLTNACYFACNEVVCQVKWNIFCGQFSISNESIFF